MNEITKIVAPSEYRNIVTESDRIIKYENNLVTLLLANGESIEALEPRRLFPVSDFDRYITLLDDSGVERGLIRNLSDIDEGSREVIEKSLNDYYLVPEIIKIISVSEKSGTIRWVVETERGEKQFDVRNRNHDIRVSAQGKVRVRDSDDNRYEIQDYHLLDAKSRAKLVPYL
jgi:hypothetical protein